MRGGYACLGLQHAGFGRVKLRAADFDIALGLHELLLIGVQRAGGGVGVGFRGVVLLFRNFALFHQREITSEIRLRELRVGAAFFDIGLRVGEVRGLRLFVSGLGAHQVGLRTGELGIGAGSVTGRVFTGARNIHAGGAGFAFGKSERAFVLVESGLIIRGV